MKKYLFIVLLVGVCFGQSDSEPKRSEIITERHENGLKKLVFVYQGEGLDEVLVAKYGFHNNGLKHFIANFKNNLLQGDYSEWHFNGQKAVKGFYKENLLENNYKTWYDNGILNEEINYQNGKMNGEYTKRDFMGTIVAQGNYINDLEDGKWIYEYGKRVNFIKGKEEGKYQAFKNNILVEEGYYANGEKVKKWTYYHDNGNIQSEGLRIKNYKNGEWVSFDSMGTKISSQVFENGKIYGLPYKELYKDGTIKLKGQFNAYVEKMGKWEYFDNTGFKTDQKIYNSGLLDGLHERFSKEEKEVTEYKDGKKTGIWQVWRKGNLIYQGKHKNGVRVGVWNSYENFNGKNLIVSEDNYRNGDKIPEIKEFNYNNDGTVLLSTTEFFDIEKKVIRTFFENGDLKTKKSYEKKIAAWDKEYPEYLYAKYIRKGKYLVLDKNREIDTARYYINDDKYIDFIHADLPHLDDLYNYPIPTKKDKKEERLLRKAYQNYIQTYYERLTKELFNSFKSKLLLPEEFGKSDSVWKYMARSYDFDFWNITKNEIEEKSNWQHVGLSVDPIIPPVIEIFNINFDLEKELEKKLEKITDRVAYNLATKSKRKIKESLKDEYIYNIRKLDFYKNDIQDFENNYRDKAIDAFLDIRKKEKKYRQTQQIKEKEEMDKAFRTCCIYPLLSVLLLSAL